MTLNHTEGRTTFSSLAITGFVLSFFISLAGLIVSLVALSQLKKTGDRGRGLATAGVVISIVQIIGSVIFFVVYLSAM